MHPPFRGAYPHLHVGSLQLREIEHQAKVPLADLCKSLNCFVLTPGSSNNLDVKNPHETDEAHRDPAELLAEYQAAVAEVREKLRQELESALLR
jgi:hypothetical protein